MSAAVCLPVDQTAGVAKGQPMPAWPSVNTGSFPPINFFYLHFHNAIRSELVALTNSVLRLEQASEPDLREALLYLKERYSFLEQVYKYHSSVEDEVVYPALDSKVRNVTQAYTVEHEDEERLFEQLSQLLTAALGQSGKPRAATVRQLVCKVEEIHTTLRKHLAKEEEQLFPLLLQHFSYAEQAELVAQFLCCIPLAAVEVVLAWLKPTVPQEEQEQLLQQVQGVVPDTLLLQLLEAWLAPATPHSLPRSPEQQTTEELTSMMDAGPCLHGLEPSSCCRHGGCEEAAFDGVGGESPGTTSEMRHPLQEILHFHQAIRSALESFVDELRAAQKSGALEASLLSALVERHRFLRAVCMFHSASEDQVLFPAARQLCLGPENCEEGFFTVCEEEHLSEASLFEELGRLLSEVKAYARRGAKEAAALTEELCGVADMVRGSISAHMDREEVEVLPLLERHLCAAEQRAMVWRTLRAMPLRLLERVLPWVAGKLSDAEASDMLQNMQLAAPQVDAALVELLSRWAKRGRERNSPEPAEQDDDPQLYKNSTCGPAKRPAPEFELAALHSPKRKRSESAAAQAGGPLFPFGASSSSYNPIDHIFQFHKALRRDLSQLESDAQHFAAAVDEASECSAFGQVIQQLEGRFQFLWGIYRAHSMAEDEIVFPALEAKEKLHNVSHAYTLDHQREEQLFTDLHQVLGKIRAAKEIGELRAFAGQLHRMSAGVRATLEQHVRAEEQELWPLFAENFSTEEQETLVGIIIGRTGAEVLQAMLPWVTGSFTDDEQRGMMDSLRSATKNTMFDQWLDATLHTPSFPVTSPPQLAQAANAEKCGKASPDAGPQTQPALPLVEVAQYLETVQPEQAPGSGSMAESFTFRPGWEDIFRMNQKQLEVAVRRMYADPSLEPERKAYLMQHIMVSRYIVAQQKRMVGQATDPPHCTYNDRAAGVLGCKHYKRDAQLVAGCCGRVYTCRHCHDEAEDHRMDSYNVADMVCMSCGTRQPVAGQCSNCTHKLARYYCKICHLFDNEPGREIYHCPYCNLCRLGKGLGIDTCHCMKCNCCMHLSEFAKHKCRDVSTCPVCTEYLFDSNKPYRELRCGHFMHSHCFAEYTRYNYTCPVCSKSLGDMSVYFRMIDSLVASAAALPPQYAKRRQAVLCNDCERKGEAPFHFVYHQCPHCKSYNTRVL